MQGDGKGKWFSRPVVEEYPALASQYLSIIERPMDFRTLRKNLEKSIYKKFDEFGSDFKLIFLNAMSFNPATEAIHIWAKDLLKKARIRKISSRGLKVLIFTVASKRFYLFFGGGGTRESASSFVRSLVRSLAYLYKRRRRGVQIASSSLSLFLFLFLL